MSTRGSAVRGAWRTVSGASVINMRGRYRWLGLVSDVETALFELALALLAAVFLDDAAVEEVDRTIGVPRIPWVVRDHADRRAFAVQFAQQLHDGFAVLGVEVSGRLVRQQDRRRPGD